MFSFFFFLYIKISHESDFCEYSLRPLIIVIFINAQRFQINGFYFAFKWILNNTFVKFSREFEFVYVPYDYEFAATRKSCLIVVTFEFISNVTLFLKLFVFFFFFLGKKTICSSIIESTLTLSTPPRLTVISDLKL